MTPPSVISVPPIMCTRCRREWQLPQQTTVWTVPYPSIEARAARRLLYAPRRVATHRAPGGGAREQGWIVFAVTAFAALLASLGLIGADALWLVPVGGQVAHGHLPHAILLASAPSSGWHDVPALAQLAFWAAYHALGGDRGLLALQVAAAAVGFWALARGLVREAAGGTVIAVSFVVLVGSLTAVFVVGVSLFSLALFPLLLLLLESESRRPSRRIWLAVAIVLLWGNLHGAVLAGWGLLACYAVFDRARREPWVAAGVLAAATAALFVNPALAGTLDYYRGVFGNEARRMGVGLWKPLELGGVDLLMIAAAAVLLGLVIRGRRAVRLWEAIAIAGLVVGTIGVARNGTWLLFVAAYPAARGLRLGEPSARVLRVAPLVFAGAALILVARGPTDPGSRPLASRVARLGAPVLASAVLGQQVQVAGGRVWVDNPIDAFRRADQRLYLLWVDGKPGGAAAVAHAGYVLVARDSAAGRLAAHDRRLRLIGTTPKAALYRVQPGG